MKQRFYFANNDLGQLAKELLDKGYNQLPDVCPDGEMAEDKIIIDTMNNHFWYCNDDSYEFHVRIIANAFQETIKMYKPETEL